MKRIDFTKMVASGNDFVIAEASNQPAPAKRSGPGKPVTRSFGLLARDICERKFGVGADGLLVLEKSRLADIKMRIFNADGSEAAMCGNGARCVALYLGKPKVKIETQAGIIESCVNRESVKIKLTDPKDIKLDIPLVFNGRTLQVNFINTGVPHAVIFVEGLDKIHVFGLGRVIRYHKKFSPAGTNVDFVEIIGDNDISIRTYERGVEDETLACGTGAVAAALITNYKLQIIPPTNYVGAGSRQILMQMGGTNYKKINVRTRSGEILKVYFVKKNNKFSDVWLKGKAKVIYKGVYNV